MAFPIEPSSKQTANSVMSRHGSSAATSGRRPEPDWDALCSRIMTVSGPAARRLPVDILTCLTTALTRVEISVYVEDCIPAITDAAHAFLLCMGTFSERRTDRNVVDTCRKRLVSTIRILEDELRLCEPVAADI